MPAHLWVRVGGHEERCIPPPKGGDGHLPSMARSRQHYTPLSYGKTASPAQESTTRADDHAVPCFPFAGRGERSQAWLPPLRLRDVHGTLHWVLAWNRAGPSSGAAAYGRRSHARPGIWSIHVTGGLCHRAPGRHLDNRWAVTFNPCRDRPLSSTAGLARGPNPTRTEARRSQVPGEEWEALIRPKGYCPHERGVRPRTKDVWAATAAGQGQSKSSHRPTPTERICTNP